MNVLVLNCGSSSLKYRLISMPGEKELAGGEAQRIGPPTAEPSQLFHRQDGCETVREARLPDHASAFLEVMRLLEGQAHLAPDALGHRVVHGGDHFTAPTLVTAETLALLEQTRSLAPIHNPPAIGLIASCHERFRSLPQIAVFDTAFHATLPEAAYTYALPRRVTKKMGIRKYGFHGTSHAFVMQEAARILDIPLARFDAVSCHLGSGGASLCAIRQGRSIENTMGYSPLQGLIMSTRCGDVDPGIVLQLLATREGDVDGVSNLLNRNSGVLGLSGQSADIRDIFKEIAGPSCPSGRIQQTGQAYLWRIRRYLGAYLALVRDARAVIFTDTIGETMPTVRSAVCANMQHFGLVLDEARNAQAHALPADVSAPGSVVRILVVATNEELAIARQTWGVLGGSETSMMNQGGVA